MHKPFILLALYIRGENMKTYVEVFVTPDGEKASELTQKLHEIGMEPSFGEHDFVYNWKDDVTISEVLSFVDRVQSKLSGSGTVLKFATIR